jgi:TrmH family RNA methyltransferase
MIESLHSPHVGRVKALVSSKGNRERKESGLFVAEGVQAAREALDASFGPTIETLYYTAAGAARIADLNLSNVEAIEVSDAVMEAMTSTVTPQGVLALCSIPDEQLSDFKPRNSQPQLVYLHEIQDPGNAGTILRSADANGFDAVITSPGSVDFYSPKVVRSTAGSLWHTPIFQGISLTDLINTFPQAELLLLSSHAKKSLLDVKMGVSHIAIFGNEARGVSIADLSLSAEHQASITEITIPMAGRAESLNLSAAASIVMFQLSQGLNG